MNGIDKKPEFFRQRFVSARVFLAMTLVTAAVLLTSACGFKLRGQVDIPAELNPMYFQAQGESRVKSAILQDLQGSQVQLAATPADARVIVRITNEVLGSRVVAVDRGGKALAYELHYQVTFDAVAPDGKELASPQTLNVVRSQDNPNVQVLGEELESNLIYDDMARDAANRILARLRAVLL